MKCRLCEIPSDPTENILFENSLYYIVETKKMKGHHKRIMVVTKKHISYEAINPQLVQKIMIKFISFCKTYFDEQPTFALVESTHATLPDHWHKVACDWFATPEELEQLHFTPHIAISTNVQWKPQ